MNSRATRLVATAVLPILALGCQRRTVPPPEAAGLRGVPPEKIITASGAEMVLLSGGTFLMGDDGGADDQRPAHRVRLGALYMDVCEVTQQSYESLMGRNPSKFIGPQNPVERVSWHSAVQYCNMRSLREGLQPCYDPETLECDFGRDGYRLPTEAEWEYACRAGTATRWSCGNDPARLAMHAWFQDNSSRQTHPVGRKRPNAWGLHDMHGNVAEWCHDVYRAGYPPRTGEESSRGPASGQERVVRGGSWASSPDGCRSAARASETPKFADACFGTETYGFRCVRRAEAE